MTEKTIIYFHGFQPGKQMKLNSYEQKEQKIENQDGGGKIHYKNRENGVLRQTDKDTIVAGKKNLKFKRMAYGEEREIRAKSQKYGNLLKEMIPSCSGLICTLLSEF